MRATEADRPGRVVGTLLAALFLQGCDPPDQAVTAAETTQCGEEFMIKDDGIHNPHGVPLAELNTVTKARLPPAAPSAEGYPIPPQNFCIEDAQGSPPEARPRPRGEEKISPVLQEWLVERARDEEVEIIVQFEEDMEIPRIPVSTVTGEHASARDEAIDSLIGARRHVQKRHVDALKHAFRFRQTGSFWLVNAVSGTVRLRDVRQLAELDGVTYLQPVQGGEPPPEDTISNNEVDDGRAYLDSDAYFDLPTGATRFALLDTGVRESHVLFQSPGNLGLLRDCIHGGSTCDDTNNPNYTTGDDLNHGTSAAAILAGSAELGDAFRGVTRIPTDVWKVYPDQWDEGVNSAASVNAIQAAVGPTNYVVIAELQVKEDATGAVAAAADRAYDAGLVVVAANGNFAKSPGALRSPAIAHKAIGVGAFAITSGNPQPNQSVGPAADGRSKPDLQAPSFTETASNATDSALKVFDDTSGATPYAGAAAALIQNWLGQVGNFENGHVYAFMILFARGLQESVGEYSHQAGAGRLKMGTRGWAWLGKVVVENGMTIDIPINVGPDQADFDVALWWPEIATQAHSDINVSVLDDVGDTLASATSPSSVFERTGVPGNLKEGAWTVRIEGHQVTEPRQLVYWAAMARNQ